MNVPFDVEEALADVRHLMSVGEGAQLATASVAEGRGLGRKSQKSGAGGPSFRDGGAHLPNRSGCRHTMSGLWRKMSLL